jgi:hypothetical protein
MYRIRFFPVFLLILSGCATSKIDTMLPPDHPANPMAAEAVFILPANPFDDGAVSGLSEDRPSKTREDAGQKPGDQHEGHGTSHQGGPP